MTADPDRPPTPESAARRQRKLRVKLERAELRKLRQATQAAGVKRGKGVVPIPEISNEDKLRVKLELRSRQRGVTKDGTANIVIASLPGTHALSLATRYIDGGREHFIDLVKYAALDNHPDAVAWWVVYADLTESERKIVSFDDVCAAAGVRPSKFVGLIVEVAMEIGRDVGNLVMAMTHPKVVEAAAKSAQRIDGDGADIGFRDRERFMQGQGLYPTPKAMSINVSANATAAAAAKNEPSVPTFSQALTLAESAKAALPAGTTALPSFLAAHDGVVVTSDGEER